MVDRIVILLFLLLVVAAAGIGALVGSQLEATDSAGDGGTPSPNTTETQPAVAPPAHAAPPSRSVLARPIQL